MIARWGRGRSAPPPRPPPPPLARPWWRPDWGGRPLVGMPQPTGGEPREGEGDAGEGEHCGPELGAPSPATILLLRYSASLHIAVYSPLCVCVCSAGGGGHTLRRRPAPPRPAASEAKPEAGGGRASRPERATRAVTPRAAADGAKRRRTGPRQPERSEVLPAPPAHHCPSGARSSPVWCGRRSPQAAVLRRPLIGARTLRLPEAITKAGQRRRRRLDRGRGCGPRAKRADRQITPR